MLLKSWPLVAAFAVTVAIAPFAHAGTGDDTAEATFGGVWRIVDAKPAPWVKPHALTSKEAPLLGYQLKFDAGEVKGPPQPLACRHARYHTVVVPPQGLFQGGLPKNKEAKLAQSLGFETPEISTLRVDCDMGTFDYHLDGGGRLLFALNDVVFTMEHLEQSDAKPGLNAPSFDCLRAKTGGEKTICHDPALAKSDRDMADAYARLKKTGSAASFATVQAAQRAWLAYVTKNCHADAPLPADQGALNTLTQCLSDEYSDRAERLAGPLAFKSGPLFLEPRMRFFTKAEPDTSDSDIYPWMGGGPEAASFNAFIAKALKLDKRRMDDKDLFPFGTDIDASMKLYARRSYAVTRFDRNIASLQVSTYDFSGGAHEAINEFSLNWDVSRDREIKLSDVFTDPAKAIAFVTKYCVKDLHDQTPDAGADDFQPAAVQDVVKDAGNWLFGADKATVHFTVYTVTSFAGGEHDVDVPYKTLKPFLRPDAVILRR